MTETLALLDAIEQFPDDDALRGAYADELEKDGYNPRAELIRLQVELAKFVEPEVIPVNVSTVRFEPTNFPFDYWQPLFDRESELLTQHAAEFRRGPQCTHCIGIGFGAYGDGGHTSGARCKYCHGTGDAGGLMRQIPYMDMTTREIIWEHTVEWHRGFPRVFCRMEECVKEVRVECKTCVGRAKIMASITSPMPRGWESCGNERCNGLTIPETVPSDWLLSVVKYHQGVEVWVTDREPFLISYKSKWAWLDDDSGRETAPSRLPQKIFTRLLARQIPSDRVAGAHKEYDTKELAQVALARAIPAWARKYLNKEKS